MHTHCHYSSSTCSTRPSLIRHSLIPQQPSAAFDTWGNSVLTMAFLQEDAQSKPKRPHVTEGVARCRHGGESRREWGFFQREQTFQDMRRLRELWFDVRW